MYRSNTLTNKLLVVVTTLYARFHTVMIHDSATLSDSSLCLETFLDLALGFALVVVNWPSFGRRAKLGDSSWKVCALCFTWDSENMVGESNLTCFAR